MSEARVSMTAAATITRVKLVGEVHGGLPAFVLPNISLFPHLWPAAVGIALMSFVETAAAGRAVLTNHSRKQIANCWHWV